MRILIDGPDLTGKTTLARSLTDALRSAGYEVSLVKGGIFQSPFSALLSYFPANKHPRSALLNSAYILSALLDSFRPIQKGSREVIVCESYVDRAIAYGIALKLPSLAMLARLFLRYLMRFDLVVALNADYETRLARLQERQNPTIIDLLTTQSIELHSDFIRAFNEVVLRHRRCLHFNTTHTSTDEAVNEVTEAIMQMLSNGDAPVVTKMEY